MKFIFVVGSLSGLGKGIIASSVALLLKNRNYKVEYIKFDPYWNANPSTISPNDHGEVFCLDDTSEVDLDLGHVERIAGLTLTGDNIATAGKLIKELLEEEQRGDYLGKTITTNPFLTRKIIDRLELLGKRNDIVIAEIGGSAEDSEASAFLQVVRQMKMKHSADCLVIFISLILYFKTVEEFKTKLVQRSLRDLQSFGIIPDLLVCRSELEPPKEIIDKISNLTNIPRDSILIGLDRPFIYEIPLLLYEQGMDSIIIDKLNLKRNPCRIKQYRDVVEKYLKNPDLINVTIAIICKYANKKEAYLSLREALNHAAVYNNANINIKWLSAEDLEKQEDITPFFEDVQGILVPGGFDKRGIEGKIKAVRYAREKQIPFLGICLGLQASIVEIARNLCNLNDANSVEFDPLTAFPVVCFVEGQEKIKIKSGTMRLGAYDCELSKDSLAHELYKKKMISERYRHRYNINPEYIDKLSEVGLKVTGIHPESKLIEIMELDREIHPFFIGTQAHLEFKSKIMAPNPIFCGFVAAGIKYLHGIQGLSTE